MFDGGKVALGHCHLQGGPVVQAALVRIRSIGQQQLQELQYIGAGGCLFSARYGWDDLPDNILAELGKQTIRMEREFNNRAGLTAADDRLPAWMTREPIPPRNSLFDVPDEELDHIFDEID